MNYKKPVYLILLVLLIAAAFGSSAFLQDYLSALTDFLQEFQNQNPFVAALMFILFASLAVLLGPFSSVPLIPSAVVIWGPILTFIFLLSGWLIGNTLAYLIGRHYGLMLVTKIIGEKEVNSWINSIGKKISFFWLLLFRFVTPSETGYAFGLIKYDFKKYFLITISAEIPFGIIAIYASGEVAENGIRSLLNLSWLWAILIVAAMLTTHHLNQENKQKKS